MKDLVVVMRLRKFEFDPVMGLETKYVGPEVGFLPVYNTEEDAKKDYPDGPFIKIQAME